MYLTTDERAKYLSFLEKKIDTKRLSHTLGVEKTALLLSKQYGVPTKKAQIAALLHDCEKCLSLQEIANACRIYQVEVDSISEKDPSLLHGAIAAKTAETHFHIHDADILNAICFHTTGRINMSVLEKIIYLSDLIEPTRTFDGVEAIREFSTINLDLAVLKAMQHTIFYLIKREIPIAPNTIFAYNQLLQTMEENREHTI